MKGGDEIHQCRCRWFQRQLHSVHFHRRLLGGGLFFCLAMSIAVTKRMHLDKFASPPPPNIGPQEGEVNDDDDFALAFDESFGFFDDVPSADWELSRGIALRMRTRIAEDQAASRPALSSLDHLRPRLFYQDHWNPDFGCRHVTLVAAGDGGKWVCDPGRLVAQSARRRRRSGSSSGGGSSRSSDDDGGCLVYSVGSNGDFGFEEDLLHQLGPGVCQVHTFDYTDYAHAVPSSQKDMHFHRWGIKPSYEETKSTSSTASENGFHWQFGQRASGGTFRTLQETVARLGHEGRTIDILKIDCEGCEWATYKDWLQFDIRQILVEVHGVPEVANDFFKGLQMAGYVTFHKEPNIKYAGGDCVEYSMLKLSTRFVEKRLKSNTANVAQWGIGASRTHQAKQLMTRSERVRQTGARGSESRLSQQSHCLLPEKTKKARNYNKFSQNDEDGMLLHLIKCLGEGGKEYFEFGSEDGTEVNTRLLREQYGWRGHLLDGGNEDPSIPLHKEWFTPTNIVSLLEKYSVSKTLDLLSIDCDYDDFFIMREILLAGYKPRILVVEYNRNFGWGLSVTTVAKPVGQEGNVSWQGDCYFGASARALHALANAFGYHPVTANGVNIIFVSINETKKLGLKLPDPSHVVPKHESYIHKDCFGRTWKVVNDVDDLMRDQNVTHFALNRTLLDVKLETKMTGNHRVFYEVKESIIKMREGTDLNTWKVVEWHNPISFEEESKFSCDWTTFKSASSGKTAKMCVHTFPDVVSESIKTSQKWEECDILPALWNKSKMPNTGEESSVYLDVGANIGACVMEMLLGSSAKIIAFEPHPMNLFNLKKTVSKLDKAYQDRVLLFPIGLGDAKESTTIYAANDNMGNSVIGKVIKDNATQQFDQQLQFKVHVERLDSILDTTANVDIRLIKMDAQGFECHILEGMGKDVAEKIGVIKFEYAAHWLREMNCTDLVPQLRTFGFDVFRRVRGFGFSGKLYRNPSGTNIIVDLFASKTIGMLNRWGRGRGGGEGLT